MRKQVKTQGDSLGLHLSISCNEKGIHFLSIEF